MSVTCAGCVSRITLEKSLHSAAVAAGHLAASPEYHVFGGVGPQNNDTLACNPLRPHTHMPMRLCTALALPAQVAQRTVC